MLPMFVVTFFEFSAADVTAALAYVANMYSDMKLLILLAVGIPVAFVVIKRAMGLVPKR